MAHFAKITDTNEVLAVHTLTNANTEDSNGVETESIGQAYLEKHSNWPAAMWIQTSYNTQANKHYTDNVLSEDQSKAFRGNQAIPGGTWDPDNNIFWNPSPSPSWIKHVETASWKPPIGDAPALTAEQESQNTALTHNWIYAWNESNQSWDLTDTKA